ncbi:MAG: NAD-dependent epimerase/dehydratase family protein [Nitrospinaceae bacterium]
MRIGVTGASGFIGKHLMNALKRLPHTTVISQPRKNKRSIPHPGELESFVRDRDLIYHLAGVNRGTDEEILCGNILGTLNLLVAIKMFGSPATRVVFASSSQVYKPGGANVAFKESRATEPQTLYGISKMAAEDLIRVSGLPHTILRLANVYGPGCRPNYNSVIATFCHRAARHRPVTIHGDGRQGRDFVYIDDVVRAFLLAGFDGRKPSRAVYNIGSGRVFSLKRVVENVRRAGTRVDTRFEPRTDPDSPSYCCDSSRFRGRTGWKPEISLAKGIKTTLQWFQEGTRA